MILSVLLVTTLLAAGNAQFGQLGSFGKAATNPAGAIGKAADTASAAGAQAQALVTEWLSFKDKYKKNYSIQEEITRKANFLQNLDVITKLNQQASSGALNFGLKLNEFADMVTEEFNKVLNGYRPAGHKPSLLPNPFERDAKVQVPKSINWVELGGVTPVKQQGLCNSCHAFAACAAVEGQNFRQSGKLVELSPQQVLDCGKEGYQSYGCTGGGYVDEDYKYIKDKKGANVLTSYPYEAKDGTCKFDQKKSVGEIKGYVELPKGDEKALEMVVGTLGPVAAGIDASLKTFQLYSKGVYDDKDCKNKDENIVHAVLVVGYGTEPDGKKYWLVKNSYGPDWGENGYIKIAKDADNKCGIATIATYPVV